MARKKQKVKTLILDLWGGPGTGKSTSAALIFAILKKWGYNVELVREYVKSWAWEERKIGKYDQIYFFGKQSRYESHLYGKVDIIVTDSPVALASFYGQKFLPKRLASHLSDTVDEYYGETARDGFLHVPILLRRTKKYNPKGRYQTERQAKQMDREMEEMLEVWYADSAVDVARADTSLLSLENTLVHLLERYGLPAFSRAEAL